ncbi:MAG: hypothetical protein ACRDI2_22285, partial [Chloroflexota bacterium]
MVTRAQDHHLIESAVHRYFKGVLFLALARTEAAAGHTLSGITTAYYGAFHLATSMVLFAYQDSKADR